MQGYTPLSITDCAERRYTLWTWRKISWRNRQRRSRVNCYLSCVARSWSLRNGRSLHAERIWRRSGTIRTSKENYDLSRRVKRWGTRVTISNEVRFDHYMNLDETYTGACLHIACVLIISRLVITTLDKHTALTKKQFGFQQYNCVLPKHELQRP